MKKVFKGIAVLAATAAIGTGVAFAAGCNPTEEAKEVKGEAYALTHGTNKFISCATVTVKGDKITDCTLLEIYLPTQIKDTDSKLYETVKYGNVTMTLDGSDYKVGEQTLNEYFQSEANCKAYYEAAKAGNLKAVVDGSDVALAWKDLNKADNGYWTKQDANEKDYSRWLWNRDATVKFVKEHGVDGLLTLVKEDEASLTDPAGATVKSWVWVNGDDTISVGATWGDLSGEKTGFVSYGQLIVNAYEEATK